MSTIVHLKSWVGMGVGLWGRWVKNGPPSCRMPPMIKNRFYDCPSWWWCQWCRELDPVSFFKYDLELGSSLLKLCCWMLTLTTQSCSQAFNRCVPSKVWRCTTVWIHSIENFCFIYPIFCLLVFGILVTLVAWFSFRFFSALPILPCKM